MVNLNKEIKSGKLVAKNKILKSPCLSFPVTMELTICLPRAVSFFFLFKLIHQWLLRAMRCIRVVG